MSKHLVLPVVLVLALSACNPGQDTPPVVDDPTAKQLITEAPLGNYDGGDEIVYFLTEKPDGTDALFEAGFIKDGKLTITAEEPPAELQHRWLDSLPEGVSGLEYSEGAEEAMAVHVNAILIGDTGLMITGSTALATASNEDDPTMEFAGITWTNAYFDASYYLPHNDSQLNQHQFEDFSAFGLDSAGEYSNQELTNFYFNASDYQTYHPEGGLSHPYFPLSPDTGDESPVVPVAVKAVIASPINGNALVGESVTFSAAGSAGEGALEYQWAFGYGGEPRMTTEQTVTHTFQHADTFTITLTVRDSEGGTDKATTSITITEPEPDLVTHQVDYYTGPAGIISVPTSLLEGGVASFPIGTMNTAGLMTLDLNTRAPSEYLVPVSIALPPGTFTNPDASILIPAEQIPFIIDAVPLTSFLAVDNIMSSRGFYMYADQAVNLNVPLDMAGFIPIDLQLQAGWNFVTPESTYEGEILVNGDPQDFTWFALTMPPEPQPESITLSPEEWTGRPGEAGRVLSVQAHYDNGSDETVYRDITWSSSDENIARIVPVGHEFAVRPVSYGTAIITAEWEGLTATMTATVNTVIVDTAPPHNVDVWATYPASNSSLLGLLTSEGHLTFNGIEDFELTPITETPVVDAAYADDQDANLVFIHSMYAPRQSSALWIGDPVIHGDSQILGNTSGRLWYADRPVNITHDGSDTENTYNVSLATGWNLVTMTTKETWDGGAAFHFESAPMNALPWFYQEQEELLDNQTVKYP